MNLAAPVIDVEFTHFHLYCGAGGGAKGFNKNSGRSRVGNLRGRWRCVGGVDNDPAAIRDFTRVAGVEGTVIDLFDEAQYRAFHGKAPPAGWREATPADLRRAAHGVFPNAVFLSAPCKGFSGLLPEKSSASAKYQALNGLTLRGIMLMLEAFADDLPELVIFENVPRIASRGSWLLDRIKAVLRAARYAVFESPHDCGVIGGLGQSRKRWLLVARHEQKVPPFLYQPEHKRLRGVGEVLERLPLPGDPRGGPMHRIPALQWKTWVRLAFVEAGSDWRSLNKLAVEHGVLRDFGIVPDVEWQGGVLGVHRWEDHAGVIAGRSSPTNGSYAVADPRPQNPATEDFKGMRVVDWERSAGAVTTQRSPGSSAQSVADPRVDGHEKSVQLGVRPWDQPSGVVTGKMFAGGGPNSVADPRIDGKTRFNNVFRIVPWTEASPAVAGPGGPAGGLAVADPRPSQRTDYKQTKYRVTGMEEAAGAVIAASTTGNGAYAVADPRTGFGPNAHRNKLKVVGYEESAGTVTGADRVGSGALSVADPRPGYGQATHHNIMQVHGWDDTAKTITSGHHPAGGALSVADPRPVGLNANRENYLTGGHYGVVPWDETTRAVPGFAKYDRGPFSVADPRAQPNPNSEPACQLPEPGDRLVCVIRALDGTWHRPFTTLDLAALQSYVDPDEINETFALDGKSDSAWRERIGNMVPPDAAEAVAGVMATTLLLAKSGQTFILSNQPIWVRPFAAAMSIDHSPNRLIFEGDA